MLSVCACSPPRSPSVWPLPMWMGARDRRAGRAKLTRPSPPYVVPSSEKRGWFWLMGNSCPSHSAQPLGGKTKLMIRISERNGSAIDYLLSFSQMRLGKGARCKTTGRRNESRSTAGGILGVHIGLDPRAGRGGHPDNTVHVDGRVGALLAEPDSSRAARAGRR